MKIESFHVKYCNVSSTKRKYMYHKHSSFDYQSINKANKTATIVLFLYIIYTRTRIITTVDSD